MLNDAAKYSIGVAAFAGLTAIATVLSLGPNDRATALLLVAAVLAAGIVAYGAGTTIGSDPTPFAAPGEEPALMAIDPDDIPAQSFMPLIAAAGLSVAVAGGALGSELVVEGALLAAAGLVGWLAGSWRTHPGFSRRDAANLDDRLLGPVALPVVAFVITALVAISLSRVLLAVSATASWIIALIVASVVLAVLWTLAHRGVNPRLGAGLAAGGLVAVLAAGGAGASAGPREFHSASESEVPSVELVAKDIKFEESDIELPADQDAEIVFLNLDAGVNHNVAVYTEGDPGAPVFNGRPILSGEAVYKLRTPAVGVYRYVCDFHPTMVGKLNVVKPSAKPTDEDGETEH